MPTGSRSYNQDYFNDPASLGDRLVEHCDDNSETEITRTHENAPLVSIIIPSRNSGRTIKECLRSIIDQSYSPIEIIVVDCCSTDSTRAIAENWGAFIIVNNGERSIAKNLGAEFAKGKYLFFLDADHKLGPTAIADCVNLARRADGVVVRDQDISTGSTVSRLVAKRRKILSYDALNVAPRFVRKDAFDRIGGFDPDLYAGEDLDLQKRFLQHGFDLAYSSVEEWHLGSPVDLKGLLNRNMYYSSNYLDYASKNPLISLMRMNPLRIVTAWKNSNEASSYLPLVVLLGFLSNAFLMIGIMLNLAGHMKIVGKRD